MTEKIKEARRLYLNGTIQKKDLQDLYTPEEIQQIIYHDPIVYGYARVSTLGQANNGNSLEEQIAQLKAAGATVIVDEYFTGTTTNRPKFKELIEKIDTGDTLMVTKLDRFARSATEGASTIQYLIDKGITVNVLNMGIMDNKPVNKLMVTMMLAFAQFERDMIMERTMEGKRIAKTRPGYQDGRPRKYINDQINHALDLLEAGNSYSKVAKMTGISASTLTRRMRERKAARISHS